MVMCRSIQIRLKKDQYAQIKDCAVRRGFNSLSAYLRYLALDKDFAIEQKISQIHAFLLGSADAPQSRRYKKNPLSCSR